MHNPTNQTIAENLLQIKKTVEKDKNGDSFIIVRTKKNLEFMREYNLNSEDIKRIIKGLSTIDCFSGPEPDRNVKYDGWIFKFSPNFEGVRLYIKIRVENKDKSVCISVHEFGKYNEVS